MSKFHLSTMKSMVGEILADLETIEPEKLRMWSSTLEMQVDKAQRAHARQHTRGLNTPDSCATHRRDQITLLLCHDVIDAMLTTTQPKPPRGVTLEELLMKAILAGR